jgi:hypothetical protein
VCWEGFFGFNYKIIINVQESPLNIMVTRNLWSARVWVRDWLCKGRTHLVSLISEGIFYRVILHPQILKSGS